MKRGPAAVSLLPKTIFFAGAPAIFFMAFFSRQLNDTLGRVGAWVGCEGFFAGCGGPERTPKHHRVKESEAEGYIVLPKRLGTPTSLSVPPLPATPPASAFSRLWLGKNPEKDTEDRITEQSPPPPLPPLPTFATIELSLFVHPPSTPCFISR